MGVSRSFSVAWLCLFVVLGLFGPLGPVFAQQQEKRIALVIGNGAYAKSPLATAANDGGLIAQTLQAAGFDVVGARDLDGDTLRRSFRDFVQKAQASGPDTVAMVYLSGYGLQLAGENYFVPVDTTIARETDIPTEGLRISDYVRQLGALPLKASIVVLDAARQQPFIEGGQPIAGGLALVEPEARMLIAFNAAPGTVAPPEEGPYGVYAQSLAEMIRTGGLPLTALFDRVRLRVNETSKGALVPWQAQKLDTNFVFFDRAPDAPPQPPPDQVAQARNRPIRDAGAQEAYAMALERDTLQGYDEFLTAYPGDPMAKRVRALAAARREAITWQRSYRVDTPPAYWSYLRRYPQGPHSADAHRRLLILSASLEPPSTFALVDYDVPPPPPEEIVYVDRPVLVFSDPYFGFVPPPPPPVFFLPPPPPDFIVLAPPPPPVGLFILPQPLFVPMPVYVRPPIYVAPPPNNIIYANIHNTTVINTVINRPPLPGPGPGPGAGLRPGGPGSGGLPSGARGPIPVTAPGPASPALPPSVAQRASLIQQGKAPVPPSASINPAVRPGAPGAPSGAAPTVQPANAPAVMPQGQPLPRANPLPVPGAKGAPPVPPGAGTGAPPHMAPGTANATPSAVNPNAKGPGPSGPQQGMAPPSGSVPNAATGPGASRPPVANLPAPAAGTPPKTPGAPVGTALPSRQGMISPPPSPNAGRPPPSGLSSTPKLPPGTPAARVPSGPPQPRIASPSPPPRAAAPPSTPSRMNAPPPPPRASAPPPPPPRMAAPSPPPAPRASPPPPPRMSAPPPPQRMAAPPPARPAAPPAKRCPPNEPKC
jgi:uncharacterized caspase-like protein